ncbi:hypothetical protein IV102_08280 [bacterium]|nr:hypothetical protein [bacterium]
MAKRRGFQWVNRASKAIRSLLTWLAEEDDPEVVPGPATELGPGEFDQSIAEAEEQI